MRLADAGRLSTGRIGAAAVPLLAAVLLLGYGALTRHGPALADEFIYLAGARHFAAAGSLDARFYDARAILHQGHPHQDNHAAGYVLALGSLTSLVGGAYGTAVALNVFAYLAAASVLYSLARQLGRAAHEAAAAAALLLLLPALLPYVFWAMAEVLLVALFLASLAVAARFGDRLAGGIASGLLFGATFLVRESAIFGLPALLTLLRGRRAAAATILSAGLFGAFVYAPLSLKRSEGASNFWTPTYGKEFGFQVVQAARQGQIAHMARVAAERAQMNLAELFSAGTTHTERGILLSFALLPCWAFALRASMSAVERRFLAALTLGWLALVCVMVFVYVAVRWAGFRYLLFLAAPFLALVARPSGHDNRWLAWSKPLTLAAFCLALNVQILGILNDYKASRQRRQEGITSYVEAKMDTRGLSRVALTNGWLFGLKHYPVEVISSLPENGGELRLLEQKIWFDYLVLPGNSPLGPEWEGRLRYRRINADEAEPPLLVYKRLK